MYADIANTFESQEERALALPAGRGLGTEILDLVMRHRRMPRNGEACASDACVACAGQHLDRVTSAIARRERITFVLPAFPGKSPNPAKVLGPRPDMAERQSLAFLDGLCRRIGKIYAPGARIILCSDGRVFNDVVGIADHDITTYQRDLDVLIAELGATNLSTFNLDEIFRDSSFDEMRSRLMAGHAEPLEALRAEVHLGGEAHRMYCGITRFLYEDALRPGMTMSKSALQKDSRRRAYEVIQRSRAWDKLLARHFPEAVRLSIHPQGCGGRKIGIHLMETEDEWLTAWHSVAVEVSGRFRLMKRAEAEKLGAELVFRDGRPSHYVVAERGEGRES